MTGLCRRGNFINDGLHIRILLEERLPHGLHLLIEELAIGFAERHPFASRFFIASCSFYPLACVHSPSPLSPPPARPHAAPAGFVRNSFIHRNHQRVVAVASQGAVFDDFIIFARINRRGIVLYAVNNAHLQAGIDFTARHRDRHRPHMV